MNRRDILKLGAITAGAGAGLPGCAVPKPVAEMRGAEGAAAFNAMLDEQLKPLEGPGLLARLAAFEAKKPLTAEAEEALADKDAMFRRMLGSILVTQAFRELPEETQREPAVQARMWKHVDDISGTVYETGEMLASLDANERAAFKKQLRARPELAMELGEALDTRSARAGLSGARRRQLRQMMSQTAFRLHHGDPTSIIDEYVDKIDKLRETSARDAAVLERAEVIGERDFWRHQHLRVDDPATANTAPAAPATSGPTAPADPEDRELGAPPAGPPAMAALLTNAARRAARHGHCHVVTSIGARVVQLDKAYYEQHFELRE